MRMFSIAVVVSIMLGSTPMMAQQFGQPINQQNYVQYRPEWAINLIKDAKHDFGTVARASKHEHTFEFANPFKTDMTIGGIRASCGCATPQVMTNVIKPGGTGKIKVTFNTLAFLGQRKARITATVTSPQYAEVYMDISGHVRQDVVVSPSTFDFNSTLSNEAIQRTMTIRYAGNPNWKIVDVKSSNKNLTAKLKLLSRQNGRIDYQLIVGLKNSQEPGYIHDQIVLVTNDVKRKEFPIAVQGQLKSLVEVQELVDMGQMEQGKSTSKKIVLRSKQAFAVTGVSSATDQLKIEPSTEKKRLHILEVEVDPDKAGLMKEDIVINTDVQSAPTTVRVIGNIKPAIETEKN